MKMQSACYNSGSTPLAHHRHPIGTPSEHHNHTTDTPQAHTWHTIGTPSRRHWHAIGTPLTQHWNINSHHRHTLVTPLAHPWHTTSTPMAHFRPHGRSGCCHQENKIVVCPCMTELCLSKRSISVKVTCGSQKCLKISIYQRHDFVICDIVRFGICLALFRKTSCFLFQNTIILP
jgi:hypothetical protein